MAEVSGRKWDEEYFFKQRQEVLAECPAGREVDLAEAVAYHRSLPEGKNYARKLSRARQEDRTLLEPRFGVANIEEILDMCRTYQQAGADGLGISIDSFTRLHQYDKVEQGMKASERQGRNMLNGFPIVYYGVSGCRRCLEAVDVPISLRQSAWDIRLMHEVAFAGGFSASVTAAINCTTYVPRLHLDKIVPMYQYVSRLQGYYEEHGVPLVRDHGNIYAGTLTPTGLGIAVNILDCLIAAQQGVCNFCLYVNQGVNVVQDVAALRTLSKLGEHYFRKLGHQANLFLTYNHATAEFPKSESEALAVISLGTAMAALSGCVQKIMTKSVDQGLGLPLKVAQIKSLQNTRHVLNLLRGQRLPDSAELNAECDLLTAEATAIVDWALEKGDGDAASGSVKAFDAGVIDLPFSSNVFNANKVKVGMAEDGKMRYVDCGNLPFPKDIAGFHRAEIERAKKSLGLKHDWEMVLAAVYAQTASHP